MTSSFFGDQSANAGSTAELVSLRYKIMAQGQISHKIWVDEHIYAESYFDSLQVSLQ